MAKFTKGSTAAREAGRKGAAVTNARKRATPQAMNTYYILCIDASGSMAGWEREVEATIQQQLDLIALNKTGNVYVSIYDFGFGNGVDDYSPRQLMFKTDPKTAKYQNYRALGNTPMWDCLGRAIIDHTGFEDAGNKDAAILIVITDGHNNVQKDFTSTRITELISKVTRTDRWTIAAHVAPGSTYEMEALGIPRGNIKEWERSKLGFQDVQTTNVVATASYTSMRGAGVTSSANYMTPNLANLKATTVKKELTDRSKDFKALTVEKEVDIKAFVTEKTGKYIIGSAYFPLTKPEKVQKTKQVALVKKGTKAVYTGAEARELIGLPDADAKVTPGNHGDWDIYVQSTSPNRKLVRGTKLLLDLTHTVESKPTWDYKPKE